MAFARRRGGELVLRIEDTDRTRSSDEHERRLMEALRCAGIEWQEGPDVGGPHGPYRQSERIDIYSEYAKQLVNQGCAYYSFTTPEELAAWRKRKDSDGPAPYESEREQSTESARKRIDAGTPLVIRMKTPREGSVTVFDTLRGEIPFDLAGLDDQMLLKSDGFPTHHLAVKPPPWRLRRQKSKFLSVSDGGGEQLRDAIELPKITEALLERGYSPVSIRKILGENHLRAFAEACPG